MAGFESLGQLIAGSPALAGDEGFLEGLDTGSRIRARQASTESALALARQRRDENVAKAKLSELFADDPELAGLFQSGIDPRQLSGFREDEQGIGLRDVVADVENPFGERQAAAQAIEGKPLSASDFLGPGGELFADIFAEPSLEGLQVTPTGEAQIQFDTERAKLAEERRLHPERFKSNLSISIGDSDKALSDLVDDINPTIQLPDGDFDEGLAFGVPGALGAVANTITDIVPFVPQVFPDLNQAQTALATLRNQTLNTKVLEFPGRPTNFIAQRAEALFPKEGSLFQGPEDALQKLRQLQSEVAEEVRIQQSLLPTLETKGNRDKARSSITQLAQLDVNYREYIKALERTPKEGGGFQLEVGESVTLKDGTVIRRTN